MSNGARANAVAEMLRSVSDDEIAAEARRRGMTCLRKGAPLFVELDNGRWLAISMTSPRFCLGAETLQEARELAERASTFAKKLAPQPEGGE